MNHDSLQLRTATLDDYDCYYKIRAEKINLFWTGYENAPNYDDFSTWYKNRLSDNTRDLFLLFQGKNCIGSLNIDHYDNYVLIGYSIKENYNGKGLGTYLVQSAVKLVRKKATIKSLKAWINYQNVGSIRVIEKNGFSKNDLTEIRNRFGKDELYYQYELSL